MSQTETGTRRRVWGYNSISGKWELTDVHPSSQMVAEEPQPQYPMPPTLLEMLRQLPPAERLGLFRQFCQHCGSDDPKCQCWNDE